MSTSAGRGNVIFLGVNVVIAAVPTGSTRALIAIFELLPREPYERKTRENKSPTTDDSVR